MNSTQKPATAEQLNAIQARWMALDSNDNEETKRSVFKAMESYPKAYVSANADLTKAQPLIDSMPVWSEGHSIKEAIQYLADYGKNNRNGIRLDVAWVGSTGKWISITQS